ncbi:uncharacterized protein LOC141613770 [Silene latifolia]|uniref:uncharacterized protein LOC141613770 n=1 Tax=Silene latifolia TaxID=37657 RepID=UPI003D770F46
MSTQPGNYTTWQLQDRGVKIFQVVCKLNNLKKPLKQLNKQKFSNIEKAADLAKLLLDEVQTQLHPNPHDPILREVEQTAAQQYYILHKAQLSFLRQKAKIDWLNNGDENTGFFHSSIRVRQIHNKVLNIHDIHGTLQTDLAQIENAFLECYIALLETNKVTKPVHFPTLNSTLVTLIPKTAHPTSVLEFIPIAYCNIIYKCISKLLCSRPSVVLPEIVSPNQGGFVKRRNIVENGTDPSIMWMLKAFSTFSGPSGLCLNKDKSDIYFNGVAGTVMSDIMQVSGFRKGAMPFKYLGVPISSKKLSKNDCMKLIDRITARIRSWGSKHLCYAGRLALINSILTNLQSYWTRIFLIPNRVMNRIDSICKNFLWGGGGDSYMRAPNVHWDKCFFFGVM